MSAQRVCNPQTDCCPLFDYTLTASTEVTGLTSLEADLAVPAAPKESESAPIWGIFPFVEPVIDANDPRFGILQPVLEWDYNHATHQWTITPWYEDGNHAKLCGDRNKDPGYCTCTKDQASLGDPAKTKLYQTDAPQCHKQCEPKHGPRITVTPGDALHFTLAQSGNIWTTTALNKKTNQQTSFQTTCIQPKDKLKVGFALENSVAEPLKKDNTAKSKFPGNIKFTNIKFAGNTGKIQLQPFIEPAAKKCFSWLDININNAWIVGSTDTVTFTTQPNTDL